MEQYIFINFAIFIVFTSVYICSIKVFKYSNKEFILHLERARIYESLKKYDLAVQNLTRAMQLDSQKSYFYYFLRHKQYIFLGDLFTTS